MPLTTTIRIPTPGRSILLASACVVVGLLTMGTAGAQPTQSLDRPGIDHYPSWMLEPTPFIPGQDQDYQVWEDDRFDRIDPEFFEWRREQRRKYGPEWRSRPGYEDDLRQWMEDHQK